MKTERFMMRCALAEQHEMRVDPELSAYALEDYIVVQHVMAKF